MKSSPFSFREPASCSRPVPGQMMPAVPPKGAFSVRRFSGLKGISAMKVAPRLLLAMLATLTTLSAAGCRTASMGSIAHNRPPEVRPHSTFDLEGFVAEHNENAERIQSLEAKPAITVTMGPQGRCRERGCGRPSGRGAAAQFQARAFPLNVQYRRHRFERRTVLVLVPEQEGQVGLLL